MALGLIVGALLGTMAGNLAAAPEAAVDSTQELTISVTGGFKDAVLIDPSGRTNVETTSGAESTFAGCSRTDLPEQYTPEGVDYVRFSVVGVHEGQYRVRVATTRRGGIGVLVRGWWVREGKPAGTKDVAGIDARAGKIVTCIVHIVRRAGGSGEGFDARIARLRSR